MTTIARAVAPKSDLVGSLAFAGSGTAELPATEGTAFSGIVRFEQFVRLQVQAVNTAIGSITAVNLRVRTSDLDNPDPAVAAHWTAGDMVTLTPGAAGIDGAFVNIDPPVAKWVSFGVWVIGSAVGADAVGVNVLRIVAADVPASAGPVEWVEITGSTPNLADLGNAAYGTLEYVGGLWRYTWSGASPAESSGGEDDWLSKVVFLSDLLPDFDWATNDLWLRLDLVTMTNTTFDGGPLMNVQFNDGLGTRGNPVLGWGYTDHSATNTRWVRQTATSVNIQNSFTTTDLRSQVVLVTSNTENLIGSASLIGVADIPDVDVVAAGFGFGVNTAEHEIRLGAVQAFTGPMPLDSVQEFRAYYAVTSKPPQPAFT